MNPRRYTFPWFVREATRSLIAVAFLMGLLFLGNCVGQVS